MKKTQLISLGIFSIMLIGMISTFGFAAAQAPEETPVNQNQYQGSLAGNETHQFRFRNRFQFQLQTNASVDLEMDVDVDAIGDRSFSLELNTTEGQTLSIEAKSETTALQTGAKVQTRAQHKYQYQEQLMLNISLNGTEAVQARLRADCDDPNATWAYYDEETEEWVESDSTYEDGVLTTETEHFSTWTILTPEEEAIPGYGVVGIFAALGAIGVIIIKKRH